MIVRFHDFSKSICLNKIGPTRSMEILASQATTKCFKFDIINTKAVSNLKFYTDGGKNMIVVFVKERAVYVSVSRNNGQSFDEPQKVMDVSGEIMDMQILMKEDQFVVAIKERILGDDHKRTISGWINGGNQTFSYKLCPKQEVKVELLNISLSFREVAPGRYESVDHLFYRNNDNICVESMGHPCKIPQNNP
jgi:hypothetical protein